MDKIKGYIIKTFVLIVNAALVAGGVFYFKNQQQKKTEAENLAAEAQANNEQAQISAKALELQQIVEQNRNTKNEATASNPSTVTVQKPQAVTKTVPAVTSTVKVSESSSSSKTTKSS